MPVSAHDVAREIRRLVPDVGDVKLHKLLYYCQGWHLSWLGTPMFAEPIEAWANGPVIADLWRDEKHGRPCPAERPLDESALGTLHFVLSRYGRLSGRELIHLTHGEDPWIEVSERFDAGDWFNQEIRHDALKIFFAGDEEVSSIAALADRAFADPGIRDLVEKAAERSRKVEPTRDDPSEIRERLAALS
jgi:uncharacterized phage-associated protein